MVALTTEGFIYHSHLEVFWVYAVYQVAKLRFSATLLAPIISSTAKEMLTLPEGRPKQAEKFGVRNEEVAIKAYVAWRKEEAEIPGCGTSR